VQPRVTRIAVEAVQQPFCFEVRSHAARNATGYRP
jgi:hypothetical protein